MPHCLVRAIPHPLRQCICWAILATLTMAADADVNNFDATTEAPAAVAMTADSPADEQFIDLLARLPTGFRLPYRETRAVAQQFDWYLRNPDYLERVFTRARPYLPYITAQLEQRGLPLELALLPVVESAFDPFAYSHGQAAGLWQFIPATGRRYGLDQNWWYDGRRDVIESTRAACEYLTALHRIFDGDWLLAIAAYNSGEGQVRRAIRRAGAGASFWELSLPRETEAYVPRLLALSMLVSSPSSFGIVLPVVPDQRQFEAIDVDKQIDLALAANMAAIEIDDIYRLNPGFNRWATSPDGPHRLLIPVANADQFRDRLANLPDDQRVQWKRYKIGEGDTLSEIARAHKTTVVALREANGLHGPTIRAGHHLMIPTASHAMERYRLSADERLAKKLSAGPETVHYTVRAGDSLWEISRKYDVGVRELARWNGMAPRDSLRVGRKLVIRGVTPANISVAEMPSTQRRINYTVRKGDSLARISSKFKVSLSQIRRWNQSVTAQKYLYPGQRLVMYIDVRKQSGG